MTSLETTSIEMLNANIETSLAAPTKHTPFTHWGRPELGDFALLLDVLTAKKTASDFNFEIPRLQPTPGTPFHKDYAAAVDTLNAFAATRTFIDVCAAQKIGSLTEVSITRTQGLRGYDAERTDHDLTLIIRASDELRDALKALFDTADQLGGALYGDGTVQPFQLLKRYGLTPPTNQVESRVCIDALQATQEAVLRIITRETVDIGENIDGALVIETLKHFMSGSAAPWVDQLGGTFLRSSLIADIRAYPMTTFAKIVESAEGQRLAHSLLVALGWYGAHAHQRTSPAIVAKLVHHALARALDPASNLLGYEFESPENAGKSYSALRDDIEKHYQQHGIAAYDKTAVLVSFLLRAHYPVDFQIEGSPPELGYRWSSAWVHFQHGINLAHAIEPGSALTMNYQQLSTYASTLLGTATPEQELLISATLTPPAIQWATAHTVIQPTEDGGYSTEQRNTAMAQFTDHEETLENAIQQLKQPAPQRLDMTRKTLAEWNLPPETEFISFPETDLDMTLQANRRRYSVDYRNFYPNGPASYSALDLLASGRLKGDNPAWIPPYLYELGAFHPQFLRYKGLPDIPTAFEADFGSWLKSTKAAYEHIIMALISDLPKQERDAIEQGHVQLYGLRKPTANIALDDDDRNFLPLMARYGFIIHATHEGRENVHEVLPYAGFIRRRDDLALAPISNAIKLRNSAFMRRGTLLPFDLNAHATGAAPLLNTTSTAVVHFLHGYLPAQHTTALAETWRPLRAAQIGRDVAQGYLFESESKLREAARGVTLFDGSVDAVAFLKDYVIPIWGPLEDLVSGIKSGDLRTIIMATIGLAFDVLSLIAPLAKVGSLTFRFVRNAATFGLRANLPRLAPLAGNYLVTAVTAINPLDGVFTLFTSGTHVVLKLNHAGTRLLRVGVKQLRDRLTTVRHGNKGLRLVTDEQQAAWTLSDSRYRVRKVNQHQNVLTYHDLRSSAKGSTPYLVDPMTRQPYGAPLMRINDQGSLSRHVPTDIALNDQNGGWTLLDTTPNLTKHWTRWGDDLFLEAGGITYKKITRENGQSVLKRARALNKADELDPLLKVPCRLKRSPDDLIKCAANRFINAGHSNVDAARTQGVDAVPWFTDRRVTAADTGTLVHQRSVHEIKNGRLIKQPATTLLLPKNYKQKITANVTGGNDIFKQIEIKEGLVEGIKDTRIISAVVAKRTVGGARVIVTQADEGIYYSGNFFDDRSLALTRIQVNINNVDSATRLKDEHYLIYIYNGSYDANRYIKELSPAVIDADLNAIRRDIVAGRETYISTFVGGPFDMGTTPQQAALFCKYTQDRAVVAARVNRPSWTSLDLNTPLTARAGIATELNRLHVSETTFTADNITQRATTQRLTPENKNFAYVKIKSKDSDSQPTKVYYSLSGLKKPRLDFPLTKQVDKGDDSTLKNWNITKAGIAVSPDKTHYINAQRTKNPVGTRKADPHEALFLPDLTANASGNHRMMDSEHMILNALNADKIDFTKVESIEVFSTYPTCQSCTAGLMSLKSKVPDGEFTVFEGGRLP
ncbi:hypothetical protein [Pseudomonas sp.]|uniref:hypothetical protein n=1 Tax=Pseudomonas sp. TaxID=306 RepID=UPI003FD6D293